MALFIRQQDERTDLQQKVAAQLREKLKNEKQLMIEKPESTLLNNSHESQNLGAVLVLIGAIIILGILYIFLSK